MAVYRGEVGLQFATHLAKHLPGNGSRPFGKDFAPAKSVEERAGRIRSIKR
jgi:hypothetical protein